MTVVPPQGGVPWRSPPARAARALTAPLRREAHRPPGPVSSYAYVVVLGGCGYLAICALGWLTFSWLGPALIFVAALEFEPQGAWGGPRTDDAQEDPPAIVHRAGRSPTGSTDIAAPWLRLETGGRERPRPRRAAACVLGAPPPCPPMHTDDREEAPVGHRLRPDGRPAAEGPSPRHVGAR